MAADSGWDNKVRCLRRTEIAVISGTDFRAGKGRWKVLDTLDQAATGLFGNHNPAVVRDPYGRTVQDGNLRVVFSSARPDQYIWSFRIYEAAAGTGTAMNPAKD
jgi:hypothetical protein